MTKTIETTATVSEAVTAIHFEDGQRVAEGDILVEMTNQEEHALLEEALSTAAEAKKQYDRVRPLAQRGAASTSLLDQRRRHCRSGAGRCIHPTLAIDEPCPEGRWNRRTYARQASR